MTITHNQNARMAREKRAMAKLAIIETALLLVGPCLFEKLTSKSGYKTPPGW